MTDLDISHEGDVGVVRICRPPHNFFDSNLIGDIADAMEAMDGERSVVVLHGEGKNFCAGANLRAPNTRGLSDSGVHLYDNALRLFRQPLPIVAAVQGKAVGGGLGLALAADLRVGAADTEFVANFAQIGIHHGFGLTITLRDAVGLARSLDMLYTGRSVGGEEAMRFGLLDRLVDRDDLLTEAMELARTIARSSAPAVGSIRRTMRRLPVAEIADAIAHERAEQEILMAALPQLNTDNA